MSYQFRRGMGETQEGGALRRQNIVSRHDYEVPVGRWIAWLADVFKIDQRELKFPAP
jgi:hypothetical protein